MKKILEPVVMDKVKDKGVVLTGHNGVEEARQVEVEYFDKDNKRSVYNLVPRNVQNRLDADNVKALLLKDELELKEIVKASPTLNRLRISFWREFDRAQTKQASMRLANVFAGVCPREQFDRYLDNDNFLAWILKPPVDYVNAMEEALVYGIDRLREILEVPLYQIESVRIGKDEFEDREVFNTKAADLLIKAVAMLDMRVKGAVVQKVEQRMVAETRNVTANMTVDSQGKVVGDATKQLAYEDIDARIKKMEEDLKNGVKRASKPFNGKELNTLTNKYNIKVEEIAGIDMDDVNKYKKRDEIKGYKPLPNKVTEAEEPEFVKGNLFGINDL